MTTVAVTGATGLIGRRLVEVLARRGDAVVPLSRRPTAVAGITATVWDPAKGMLPEAARAADVIVNLAGTGISDGRWSDKHRRSILQSRLEATRGCVAALGDSGPSVLINGSAIGYYGPTDTEVTESSAAGKDFLAGVCVQWEAEALKGNARGRIVLLRTGVVLSRDGGAFPRLLLPARLGAGGPLGGGRQWLSWILIDDQVQAIVRCIDDSSVTGPVNTVAPDAVRQRDFAKALGRVLHRPSIIPTPGFALRLALGGAADIALTGQRVVPEVLTRIGFGYSFPTLDDALNDLMQRA